MERKTAADYPQEILDLFHHYVHDGLDRRGFLEHAGKLVGAATAVTMLNELNPNYAWAQQIAPDDKRLKTSWETYDSPNGTGKIKGYLARPATATGKLPGVLVVHENRGLNPYVQDVVRRLAIAGFMAYGPDGLSSVGGYPGTYAYTPGHLTDAQAAEIMTDDNKGAMLQRGIDGKKLTEDWVTGAQWLKARPDCTGKIGATGFCYGGGVVNTLAVRLGADLAAGVPFYGAQPNADDTAKIKAALCLQYAGLDTGITGNWPKYKDALDANKVPYEVHIYDGANHGFHNDSTARFDQKSADLAWASTLAWFNKYLKG